MGEIFKVHNVSFQVHRRLEELYHKAKHKKISTARFVCHVTRGIQYNNNISMLSAWDMSPQQLSYGQGNKLWNVSHSDICSNLKCYVCGYQHPRKTCPLVCCHLCGNYGHSQQICPLRKINKFERNSLKNWRNGPSTSAQRFDSAKKTPNGARALKLLFAV